MSENTENKPASSGEGAANRGGDRKGKPRNFGGKKPGGFGGKGKGSGFGGRNRGDKRDGDRDGRGKDREGGRGGERRDFKGGRPDQKREGNRGGKPFDKGSRPDRKHEGNRGHREDKPDQKREGARGERREGRPFEKKYYSYEGNSEQRREGKRDFKGGRPDQKRDGNRGDKHFDKGEGRSFGKKDFKPKGDRGGFRKDREDSRGGERGGRGPARGERRDFKGGRPDQKRDGNRGDKRFEKAEKGFDVGNDEKTIPEEFLSFEEIADLRALPGTEVTHKEYGRGVIDACDATGLMRVKFHTVGLKVYNCEKALKTDTLRIRRPEQ